MAWPFADRSTPASSVCIMPAWSTSIMNFSYPMARPPSSQPAGVQYEVHAGKTGRQQRLGDSNAALRIGTLAAHRLPPERNGTPRRRASAAIVYSTSAGSGVPKVGAPDCIEIDEAKLPRTTGAPGFTSCANDMPARASASVCAAVPATVTGDIAPRENERRDDRRLVGPRIDLERAEHRRVVDHRRIHVDQVDQHRALRPVDRIHGVGTERNFRKLDTVGRTLRSRDRTMNGLSLYLMWL
jgi:hypothetical protein